MIDQTEEANSKKELQVELRSGLLPSMRDQLINLRQIIDLESDFSQQDPTSRYQLVCGIQSGIVVTYNQIKTLRNSNFTDYTGSPATSAMIS
ncbi:hypothetical protein PSTG_14037 [Puccinia striiformis f. sp. tritici PST-78]|uniref:Uncharacterized protein n=1 Tax=Puccinia striiformis f. sp. tritici PST-78 TaxID=1165861 RepID=A0A0L0UZS3_9BASI|nr:hypothetical protein PSTG_14037 [Puccinia striiformis f. sp. tritici PST-78]